MDEEQTFVDAAKSGDLDAADTLIRRYQVRIFNFARTLTANYEDAEDLAQETFVREFRGMAGFRGEASFKTGSTPSPRTLLVQTSENALGRHQCGIADWRLTMFQSISSTARWRASKTV